MHWQMDKTHYNVPIFDKTGDKSQNVTNRPSLVDKDAKNKIWI